ncbi:ABC transporter permease [Paenibacillus enshidis]|uniref:ABC transporter permease n=1 Tax=Paenibacillus enshidis TaxID=1458439 RepID=A0ABV5AX17_9BACL
MQKLGKGFMYALIVIVSLFMIVPLLFTVIGSFAGYWGSSLFASGWTLKWYRDVFHYYGPTVLFTLVIAIATVFINVLLGTMTAYQFSRSGSRWMMVLEEILTLPIAVPGVAIALALIQTYAPLREAGWLILIGHVIVTFPLIFRTVLGTLRTKSFKALDESAATLGAGPFYRFFHVILPSIKSAVLSGAMLVFLLSLGEFNMTFFLYTPLKVTLPVGLYEAYSSLRIEIGSAYTVVFLVIAVPVMFILHKLNQSAAYNRGGV